MRVEKNDMKSSADGRIVVPIGPPQTRAATPVVTGTPTLGQRMVWCRPDGWYFDLRATSDPHLRPSDGRLVVDVVDEADWYAWRLNGSALKPVQVPASTAFVERARPPGPPADVDKP
jgi:hypothetical protein